MGQSLKKCIVDNCHCVGFGEEKKPANPAPDVENPPDVEKVQPAAGPTPQPTQASGESDVAASGESASQKVPLLQRWRSAAHHVTEETRMKRVARAFTDAPKAVLDKLTLPSEDASLLSHGGYKKDDNVKTVSAPRKYKLVTYDPHVMTTWRTFLMFRATVFNTSSLWAVITGLWIIALSCSALVFFLIPNPELLHAERFRELVAYFKVFIAFMLGLYMNNCLNRWWHIVSALTDYFLAIRQLIWSLHTCGVQRGRVEVIRRYALLSCCLLENEVMSFFVKDEHELAKKWEFTIEVAKERRLVTQEEVEFLEGIVVENRCTICWSLIGNHIRLLQGHLLSNPMRTHVAKDCAFAMGRVKKIKTYVTLQLPFMYTHMLASLVHINNILLAVSCGLAGGSIVGDVYHHGKFVMEGHHHTVEGDHIDGLYRGAQRMVIAMVSLVIEPLLYQSFLQIGATLCDPFMDELYGLPIYEYLDELTKQTEEMKVMSEKHITFKRPSKDSPEEAAGEKEAPEG